MDFLTESMQEAIKKQSPEVIAATDFIESIINVNKETLEQVLKDSLDYLEKFNDIDTNNHIKNISEIAYLIRPLQYSVMKSLFESISKKGFNYSFPENIFPSDTLIEQLKIDDISALQYNILPETNTKYKFLSFGPFYTSSDTDLIHISALYRAVKCFKFFVMNDKEIDNDVGKFAIAGGNQEIVKIVANAGVVFEECLEISIQYHNHELFEWLYNNYDDDKKVIYKSSLEYNYPTLYFYLEKGCYLNESPNNEASILSYAVVKYQRKNIKNLLAKGIDNSMYGLIISAFNTDDKLIKFYNMLVELGANFKNIDKSESTILHEALEYDHYQFADMLLSNGFSIDEKNKRGETPLYYGACSGKKELVEYCLKNGANINLLNYKGASPLEVSIINNSIDFFKYMIEKGADINNKHIKKKVLFSASFIGATNIINYLIDEGFNVNERNTNNDTPLDYAIMNNKKDAVKLLIEKGADVNSRNIQGNVPLHMAAKNGNKEIVDLLIEKGADIMTKNKYGHTPLYYASVDKHQEISMYLFKQQTKILNCRKVSTKEKK